VISHWTNCNAGKPWVQAEVSIASEEYEVRTATYATVVKGQQFGFWELCGLTAKVVCEKVSSTQANIVSVLEAIDTYCRVPSTIRGYINANLVFDPPRSCVYPADPITVLTMEPNASSLGLNITLCSGSDIHVSKADSKAALPKASAIMVSRDGSKAAAYAAAQ
jgi:hypothetical protein